MQLRAVLLMLLAELPSNLPVLFLATAKVPQDELDEQVARLFGSSMYVPFLFLMRTNLMYSDLWLSIYLSIF